MTLGETYVVWTGWAAQVAGLVTLTALTGGLLYAAWRAAGRPPARRPLTWYAACMLSGILALTLDSDAVGLFFLLSIVLYVCTLVSLARVARATPKAS
jgi:hypothetical protein